MSLTFFQILLYSWIALAIVLFPIQLKITAPYGRHQKGNWGPKMSNRLGWIIMELVSPIALIFPLFTGTNEKSFVLWIMISLWLLHYFNRSLIFPFRIKSKGKQIPIAIVVSAIFFNTVNGWTNGYYFGHLAPPYPEDWLFDLRFIFGLSLFILGAIINIWSDNILINLRKPGETAYKIPEGGLFGYISCPNHFGEIIEWLGFAILAWNLPALGFFIWTATNLIPRSLSHHQWYKASFEHYPKTRKAVLPFII